jgi:hypothetical protein
MMTAVVRSVGPAQACSTSPLRWSQSFSFVRVLVARYYKSYVPLLVSTAVIDLPLGAIDSNLAGGDDRNGTVDR